MFLLYTIFSGCQHFFIKIYFSSKEQKKIWKDKIFFQIFRLLFTSEGVVDTVFQNHTGYRAIFSNYDIQIRCRPIACWD